MEQKGKGSSVGAQRKWMVEQQELVAGEGEVRQCYRYMLCMFWCDQNRFNMQNILVKTSENEHNSMTTIWYDWNRCDLKKSNEVGQKCVDSTSNCLRTWF